MNYTTNAIKTAKCSGNKRKKLFSSKLFAQMRKNDWITKMSLFIRIFYLRNCSEEAGETLYLKRTPEVVERICF
jgi:hypothetical protein